MFFASGKLGGTGYTYFLVICGCVDAFIHKSIFTINQLPIIIHLLASRLLPVSKHTPTYHSEEKRYLSGWWLGSLFEVFILPTQLLFAVLLLLIRRLLQVHFAFFSSLCFSSLCFCVCVCQGGRYFVRIKRVVEVRKLFRLNEMLNQQIMIN